MTPPIVSCRARRVVDRTWNDADLFLVNAVVGLSYDDRHNTA